MECLKEVCGVLTETFGRGVQPRPLMQEDVVSKLPWVTRIVLVLGGEEGEKKEETIGYERMCLSLVFYL